MSRDEEVTNEQAIAIVLHIQKFLGGIEPPWEIGLKSDRWEITTQRESVCTFPLVPQKADLEKIVRHGVWQNHLTILARETIPTAFEKAGVKIG